MNWTSGLFIDYKPHPRVDILLFIGEIGLYFGYRKRGQKEQKNKKAKKMKVYPKMERNKVN